MNLFEKLSKSILKNKKIGGLTIGEKAILCVAIGECVYLCADFVTASKLKFALENLGETAEIISCGRENDEDNDANLYAFSSGIQNFLSGKTKHLIFLPSSMTTTFDLDFLRQSLNLTKGKDYDFEDVCKVLCDFGYTRVDYVDSAGQFAVRGDVLDIFINGQDMPTRIEFFDEQVERILEFEIGSMKKIKEVDTLTLFPLCLKKGQNTVTELCKNLVIDERAKIATECTTLASGRENLTFLKASDFASFEALCTSDAYYFSNTEIMDYENGTIGQKSYLTDFVSLSKDVKMYKASGYQVFIFAGKFKEMMREFLVTNKIAFKEVGLFCDCFADVGEQKGEVVLLTDEMKGGSMPFPFSFLNEKIIAIGMDDVYRSKRVEKFHGRDNFSYLPKVGDYVVHSYYGIGLCKDIVRMKLSHFEKDYFVLEYKDGALLYLPTEQTNYISAYIGGEKPKLSGLGKSDWTRLKEKVKADIKEVAVELAKIYKERESKKGFVFVRDDALEDEFSRAFPYELTPDQAQAILDVDADMESPKIMDRLICGDVGFGKTEVAFRAIFKAFYNGKQTAFLCPTTILCEQHYRSAISRFAPFGVRIEKLSRFNSEKETKEILSRLEKGEIDLLIGTHKMLGEKVKFHDIGLLVLDEEQRFGVKDKEKIKSIKSNIDVLTLSATPIPRTLNMSLSKIRDISVIATPPKDRLPIQTYVTNYSDELLTDVAKRELSRGGKVLILYNNVTDIYNFASHVRLLLPNAKIGVAHGQMMEKELAQTISDLYDDKFNVFISTTLIENGIDLPNLNTLFAIDSDRLGLSQLYQIRGRIGRGDKLSYAYLTYDKGKVLTEEAYKRLEAITEFRELGSGFKIAMRDLEIRGAGNILGREQHGHMQKVGYELYVRLLEEVTKGEAEEEAKEIKLELSVDAYINENYISSQEERIVFYDKISHIRSQEDEDSVLGELKDAFGDVPKETINLCDIALLKNLASKFNVQKIKINSKESLVYFYKSKEIIDKRLSKMSDFYDISLKFEDLPILKLNANVNAEKRLKLLKELFVNAYSAKKD